MLIGKRSIFFFKGFSENQRLFELVWARYPLFLPLCFIGDMRA